MSRRPFDPYRRSWDWPKWTQWTWRDVFHFTRAPQHPSSNVARHWRLSVDDLCGKVARAVFARHPETRPEA